YARYRALLTRRTRPTSGAVSRRQARDRVRRYWTRRFAMPSTTDASNGPRDGKLTRRSTSSCATRTAVASETHLGLIRRANQIAPRTESPACQEVHHPLMVGVGRSVHDAHRMTGPQHGGRRLQISELPKDNHSRCARLRCVLSGLIGHPISL